MCRAAEAAGDDRAVLAGGAVAELPVIGERVAIGIVRCGGEGHAAADRHRGRARGEGCGGCRVSGEWPALIGEINRRRAGGIDRKQREMLVRLRIGISAAELDAAVVFSTGTARRGVDQAAAVKDERLVRERVVGRVVFDVIRDRVVFRDAERIAFPFLEARVVEGVDTIDAVGFREMDVAVRQPSKVALHPAVVVRSEAAAAAHDVERIAVFLVRPVAVGRAVGGAPVVRVAHAERVADLVVDHVHAAPAEPNAVAAAPG